LIDLYELGARQTPEEKGAHIKVPSAALWLGAFGTVPFVSLAVASMFLDEENLVRATFALITYGGVILSFLGGIQWGLAIANTDGGTFADASYRRLGFSVVPSLIAWTALFFETGTGLLVMALAFGGMLVFDIWSTLIDEAPLWYPKLRLPLTVTVVTSLVLGAAA
jgi:hypothetical protein